MNKKLVSVVIPSFNRFKYLKNAVESVMNQTYKEFEIIVINDGSTEEEYYQNKLPKNVKIIDLDVNRNEIRRKWFDGFYTIKSKKLRSCGGQKG